MSAPVKRPYRSAKREAAASATRAAVLQAAEKLFLAGGYERTTTAAIARAAGVSEASVFAVFGNKAKLLVAVVSHRVGDDDDFPLAANPRWQELASSRASDRVLGEFARVTRRAHERSWRLLVIARAAGVGDQEVADAVDRGAARRLEDMAWLVGTILKVPAARRSRVAEAFWALTSVANYHDLVIERGWSAAHYEKWLGQMLAASLA